MEEKKHLFDNAQNNDYLGEMPGKFRHQWVEESFDFDKSNNHQVITAKTNNYLGGSIGIKKVKIFTGIIVLGTAIILGRLFWLQVLNGNNYRSLAENNRIRLRPIPAERGVIYDSFGRQLVANVPSFSLSLIENDLPHNNDERTKMLNQLSAISGVTYSELENKLGKYNGYGFESISVKENLDHATAIKLYVQSSDLPGVLVDSGMKRQYLNGTSTTISTVSLSHLFGYVGKLNDEELVKYTAENYLPTDDIGKIGLEKFYETSLRGKYGRKKIEVDAMGREQNVLAEEPPIPGNNLYLTLDLNAQQKLEELVKNTLKRLGLNKAVAIAINPQTGGILAMVSLPTFDNNDFSGGITSEKYQTYLQNPDQPLFNRAISGSYPSGSTIKPIIVAGALQEGVITQNTTVNSVGGIQVGDHFFKDWKAGGHGTTNAVRAIAWSINTFFYYIGGGYKTFEGLGFERLIKYFRMFNLGQLTGIDLPGENAGFLPTREWKKNTKNEPWYIGDTYNLSIGQGDLLVTPLQVAVWTATVANGGKIVWPHLGNYFIDTITKTKQPISFPQKSQVSISKQNMETVRQGMRACVVSGSCQLLKTLGFTSGGKTGTAQWSSIKNPQAWFTAFAPFDQPKIAITILVEEGKEGSTAAMPIANEFLRWWGQKYLK